MDANKITYRVGIPEVYREATSELYDLAFGEKIALGVADKEKRIQLLEHCMMLEYAIGAFYKEQLVGLAGFHTQNGHLTGGQIGLSGMIKLLGIWKGIKAAIILSAFSRKAKQAELLMDGIAVTPSGRGKGIGSRLLDEIKQYAKDNQFDRVRLDVIDTNPKAKQLYQRMGFEVTKTDHFPRLKGYLGFGGVDTMIYRVKR